MEVEQDLGRAVVALVPARDISAGVRMHLLRLRLLIEDLRYRSLFLFLFLFLFLILFLLNQSWSLTFLKFSWWLLLLLLLLCLNTARFLGRWFNFLSQTLLCYILLIRCFFWRLWTLWLHTAEYSTASTSLLFHWTKLLVVLHVFLGHG